MQWGHSSVSSRSPATPRYRHPQHHPAPAGSSPPSGIATRASGPPATQAPHLDHQVGRFAVPPAHHGQETHHQQVRSAGAAPGEAVIPPPRLLPCPPHAQRSTQQHPGARVPTHQLHRHRRETKEHGQDAAGEHRADGPAALVPACLQPRPEPHQLRHGAGPAVRCRARRASVGAARLDRPGRAPRLRGRPSGCGCGRADRGRPRTSRHG